MKKLNRKPVYSAKPGECPNVEVKDYGSKSATAKSIEGADFAKAFIKIADEFFSRAALAKHQIKNL